MSHDAESEQKAGLGAGRELDALIAEKVMGWTLIKITPEQGRELLNMESGYSAAARVHLVTCHLEGVWGQPDGSITRDLPLYSTDIAAAWEVVGELLKKHWYLRIECHQGRWFVWYDNQNEADDLAEAEAAPLAICLAALKATGNK